MSEMLAADVKLKVMFPKDTGTAFFSFFYILTEFIVKSVSPHQSFFNVRSC